MVAAPDRIVVEQPIGPQTPGTIVFQGTYQSDTRVEQRVVYAVDVSGSTSQGDADCNGDTLIDQDDDFNGDATAGTTLDCEIAGIVALNSSFRGRALPASLVAFGDSATLADMSPAQGVTAAILSTADDNSNRVPDVQEVAASLEEGAIKRFGPTTSVGTGTDFGPPLEELRRLVEQRGASPQGTRVQYSLFFLSDGIAEYPENEMALLQALGGVADLLPITINTVSVGRDGTGCEATSPLRRIADATGGTCSEATPSTLEALLSTTKPGGLDRIEVTFGGVAKAADVDPVGRWSASFENIAATGTDYPYVVRAFQADGTVSMSSGSVVVRSAETRYVALGDSYSSGNGLVPYLPLADDPQGRLCARSAKASAFSLRLPGHELPAPSDPLVAFTLRACAGAESVHLFGSQFFGVPAQIGSLDASIDLVTLTIGGNDVLFSDILFFCGKNDLRFQCQNQPYKELSSGRKLTLNDFARIRLSLLQVDLFDGLKRVATAAPNATVIVSDYPHLVAQDGPGVCLEEVIFSADERRWIRSRGDEVSASIKRAATQAGVFFSSVIGEFAPHEVCGDGEDWMYGLEVSARERGDDDEACSLFSKKFGPLTASQTYCVYGRSFHPNAEGAKQYGEAYTAFLERIMQAPPSGLSRSGLPRNPVGTAASDTGSAAGATPGRGRPELVDGLALAERESGTLDAAAVEGISPDQISSRAFVPIAQVSQARLEDSDTLLSALTPAELAEVRGLTSDPASVADLADLSGSNVVPACGTQVRALPGQLLVVMGHGFEPGTKAVPSVTLGGGSVSGSPLLVDEQGLVAFPVLLPLKLGAEPAVAFSMTGIGINGFERRIGTALANGVRDRACIDAQLNDGLLSVDGRALPTAAGEGLGAEEILRPPAASSDGEAQGSSAAQGPLWILVVAATAVALLSGGAGYVTSRRRRRSPAMCQRCGLRLGFEDRCSRCSPVQATATLHLRVLDGMLSGRTLRVQHGQVIGRDEGIDHWLGDETVSRRHAQIVLADGAWAVVDLGSTSGTFRNGEAVVRAHLQVGDVLTLGSVTLRVEGISAHA